MAILVAYDGSTPAQQAVEHAFATYPDEEIVLLRVVEAAGGSTSAGIDLLKEYFRDRQNELEEEGFDEIPDLENAADVEYRTEVAVGQPARAIVDFAAENDVDHVVVGSHGRTGVSRVLLGSVAETVARRSPVPVTVVR
ncbi:universal stress protein [Natrarchaeobius oligotrophus]|uniref:Universal stress protein n=1 Tax=Natrarchaeobius chitinivorans TaxID=1679083 RepID=A0A3N6MI93_NATCH|nr:universal stress protein [Natrarchaeobius chitinivorans]RQH00865.1 universal stress protein [Natrarchaeobius chitinivorans]